MDPQKKKTETPNQVNQQNDTSLKWSSSGELSALDMTKILDRLSNQKLTECDLACPLDE